MINVLQVPLDGAVFKKFDHSHMHADTVGE